MKPVFRDSAVIALSILAFWLGLVLGRTERSELATPDPSLIQSSTGPLGSQAVATTSRDRPSKFTEEQLRRQVIARCETQTLWDWLQSDSNLDPQHAEAVIDELIDRLGMGAWEEAMAFGDTSQQEKITNLMLNGLCRKDVWQAFDLYQKNRAQFNEQWGSGVAAEALKSASNISTDKLVEVIQQSAASKTAWITPVEYPAGFDFKKLVDFMENSGYESICLPENILGTWASRDPLQAAEWIAAHPTPAKEDDAFGLNDPTAINASLVNIIASTDASRDAALKKFAQLPQPVLQQVWQNTAHGGIDSTILAAADHMDQREPYLIESLLKSRGNWEVDPSWQTIPPAERLQILDAAEQQWAEKSPSPIDQLARQRWRKMVTDTWSQ